MRRQPLTDHHPSVEDLNDDNNADVFAREYAADLRYDHARKRWLVWNKHWWKVDSDAAVMRKATRLLRKRFNDSWQIGNKRYTNFLQRSRNEKPLKSCLAIAATKEPIATDGTHWDSDPFLLGVQNGVIDLRTGELRDGHQSDAITRHSPVEFNPDAACPRWQQFLAEIFENDDDLIAYIQQMVGYSLTGDTSEQIWFFCHGIGANGKSTFLETLQKLLGDDLAKSLPFEELTQKKFGHSHPVGLSHLEGSRFVIAVEGPKQAAFDEQRLKLITGKDKIVARGMRENFRQFDPTFKVWLAANHALTVNDRTHAFWRRCRVIPFTARFEGVKSDRQLDKTLEKELPGILAWAVRGCLAWQRNRITTLPKRIAEAVEQYRQTADPFKEFFDDQCAFDEKDAVTPSDVLAQAYAEYRKTHPEAPILGADFWTGLQGNGATDVRPYIHGKQKRAWRGVRLIPSIQEAYRRFCIQTNDALSFEDWLGYNAWQNERVAE